MPAEALITMYACKCAPDFLANFIRSDIVDCPYCGKPLSEHESVPLLEQK